MNRRLIALAAAAIVLTGSAAVVQAQESSWIHIRVDEADGAKVNVNLPMSLVEIAMDVAQDHIFDDDHGIDIGRHHDLELADLRRMWEELRLAGDAEYVAVHDDDEHVRIYRQDDTVHIEVDDDDGDEKVRLQIPFSVVDVLLQGEGDELNLAGALREMASANDGQILQVQDGDTDVNIWIDTNPQG